jgi:hypothetical protein
MQLRIDTGRGSAVGTTNSKFTITKLTYKSRQNYYGIWKQAGKGNAIFLFFSVSISTSLISGYGYALARYDSGPRTGPPLPPNPCEGLTCPPETVCQLRRSPSCLLPLLPCPVVAACTPALPAYSLDRREDEPLTLQVLKKTVSRYEFGFWWHVWLVLA